MKSIYKFIAALALLFTLGATSFAQSARRTVIQIPFDFLVGQKMLPAGSYRVEPVKIDSNTAWEVQSTQGHAGAFVITSAIQGGKIRGESRLVFQKYGDLYVLAQVWTASDSTGRALVPPRHIRTEQDRLAGQDRQPETVTITARARKGDD
jgi:hypothetical protein